MATVWYFWHAFIHKGTTFMYLQYSRPPYLSPLPNVWKESYTISESIFVDIPYWSPYSKDKFGSCVVPGPSHGLISGKYGGCSRIFHRQRHKRSVTAAAVWLLTLAWRIMEFFTTKCRHMPHAVPENILMYNDLVPLKFWPRNVALVL